MLINSSHAYMYRELLGFSQPYDRFFFNSSHPFGRGKKYFGFHFTIFLKIQVFFTNFNYLSLQLVRRES